MGMSAPPIGMISRTPNSSASAVKIGKQPGVLGRNHQDDPDHSGRSENSKIDEILAFVRDGPLRQDFLQFSERHQAGREGQEPSSVSMIRAIISTVVSAGPWWMPL